MTLAFRPLVELRKLLRSRSVSAVEVIEHCLERIQRIDHQLNCFSMTMTDEALHAAAQADDDISARNFKLLSGIPIAHKDLFCMKGFPTSCASNMLQNFVAPYDATIVTNLRKHGAICLGKTNMDEFAMGSSGETSTFGSTINPWDSKCVAGGSSSGSAAAVAAGLVAACTGSDTGGSIRQPAAFCGITGFKPTYGCFSRYGMIAFASSLDQAGIHTHSAEDAALMYQAMVGHDPQDPSSSARTHSANQPTRCPLTVGYPSAFLDSLSEPLVRCIEEAKRVLTAAGHRFVEIELPDPNLALATYFVISRGEAASNLARFDGVRFGHRSTTQTNHRDLCTQSRSEGFGEEVKKRILFGNHVLTQGRGGTLFERAQKVRRLIREGYAEAFKKVDIILAPSAPSTAMPLNCDERDSYDVYLQDRYTVAVNLAGLPAISIPVGFIDKLPVGAQLIGRQFSDQMVLQLASQFQQLSDWHLQHPDL